MSKKYIKCKNSGPVPIPGTKDFLLDGMVVEGDYWASLVGIGYVEELKEEKHVDTGVIITRSAHADTGVIVTKDVPLIKPAENNKENKKLKSEQKKEKSSAKSLKNDKIDSSVSKPEPQESLNVVDVGKTGSGLD